MSASDHDLREVSTELSQELKLRKASRSCACQAKLRRPGQSRGHPIRDGGSRAEATPAANASFPTVRTRVLRPGRPLRDSKVPPPRAERDWVGATSSILTAVAGPR